MADRRRVVTNTASTDNNVTETERQFMDKNNVTGMIKDLLTKIISNRPDDPIAYIANYFETMTLDEQSNDLVNRAVQILNLTHHSRPVFESNMRMAFNTLSRYRINKRLHGVNGTVHCLLMQALCKKIPSAVTIRLFKRLECADHEAVTYDVFRSSVFTCCVLNDYVNMAGSLFESLDLQKTGKAEKSLCEAALEQLKLALASSRTDVKRIMESSYSLGPEGLYGALDRAMANKNIQGFYTQDQFVIEACETFLTKVKKSKN